VTVRRVVLALATATAVAGCTSGGALAAGSGQAISSCAQAMLGQRVEPPAVSCSCTGVPMTFANFGTMVIAMRTSA
jgi:hypothetical protein